ncbi:uncharacterized protein LOC126373590 [Pectinophora gossypiella]|uniref:uncharacterized protein LOC126373590 n=1 Tax=Pectinophora gossypiella TaxID=13191 RepID=UPI00214F3F9D|nr:uncharacterized protein LOC126373590 [Pectinophora gossypiella]
MPPTLTRRLMQNFGNRRSYGQQMVYQEDLDKALKELEERLKTGKRPVYMEDLRNALEDFEKRYRERQEFYATSTPSPCAEESIIKEALKPALKEDLWNFLKPQSSSWSKKRRSSKFKTRRSKKLDLATEMVQQALREEFLDNYRREVDEDLFSLMGKDKDKIVEPATESGSEDEGGIPIKIEIPNRYKYMILKTDKKI